MSNKLHIALLANDIVGTNMAGPGIRYFRMAESLSKNFEVSLFVPNSCDIKGEGFDIRTYNSNSSSKSIGSQLSDIDIVVAQLLRPPLLYKIKKSGITFIADLYDPLIIENLEYSRYDSDRIKNNLFAFNQVWFHLQLCFADHILCASDRQKDLYLGMLSSLKIINPKSYKKSDNFEKFISLAPFGIDDKKPGTKTDVVSDKFPEIRKTDKIIYWGGGIWDWFDPMSVIKAVESISKTRNDVKLVFVGVKHPNPKIKAMQMAKKALEYCERHDLLHKCVFFNFGWTPYSEIKDYLKRSFIGISAHNNNLETRFSFRTRVLDYLWAGLPIVSTEGDSMADLVEKNNLGIVVGYNNSNEIEEAILKLIKEPEHYKKCQDNIRDIKSNFYWDNICSAFTKKILSGKIEKRPLPFLKFIFLTFGFYFSGLKKKLFK